MSVLLAVKMDLAIPAGAGLEAVNGAFPIEGAYRMLKLPGLQWKIWGTDMNKKEACGFYLFATMEDAKRRAAEVVGQLQVRPGISNVTTQIWELDAEKTRITHGPIDVPKISDLPK